MENEKNVSLGMEEGLKKATAEMLVLYLLSMEDMHSAQIIQNLRERSGNVLTMVSPYMLYYRLIERDCIVEAYKKIAPDGRRRQYYQITDKGREYLSGLIAAYRRFTGGVALLLEEGGESHGE